MDLDLLDIMMRIGAATLCSAVLGWEREAHEKPAGIRTNMQVSIGAATATMATILLFDDTASWRSGGPMGDPLRIVSGVIGGIGFLGAGAIIQSHGQVEGMTTAATIWVVGAIGVACGTGEFSLAIAATMTSFVVLLGIGMLERSRMAPESVRKDDADCSADSKGK